MEPMKPNYTRSIEEIRKLVMAAPQTRRIDGQTLKIDKEQRTIEMSFSSEIPVLRWYGYEILSHTPGAIIMDRAKNGLPFCNNHDVADQRGRITNFRCDEDKVTRGDVKFSRTQAGEDFWMDFEDEIRKETSIGYAVYGYRELKPEEMNAELRDMCLQEKCGAYIADSWEPLEASSAPVPADVTVGAGRNYEQAAAGQPGVGVPADPPTPQSPKEVRMEPNPNTPAPEVLEQERVQGIEEVGKKFVSRVKGGQRFMDQAVKDAIELKRPLDEFRGLIFTRLDDSDPIETPQSFLDLPPSDLKRYSIKRAILAQIPNIQHDMLGNKIDCTLERECSVALSKRTGLSPRGILVPWDVQVKPLSAKRDMAADAANYGQNLVGTQTMSFIDMLYNRSLVNRLGAMQMPGLVGSVKIPRLTSGATFYYVAQGDETTESTPVVGSVSLSPKSGGTHVDIERTLLLQSTPAADALVINDLTRVGGLAIDKAAYHGAGTNEPTGIYLTSGVGTVDASSMAWEAAVEFESDVASGNADVASMAYVTRAAHRGTLKTREKALNTAQFVCSENNMVNGYPLYISEQISSGYIFFGNFAELIVAYWGGLDLLVNPYILSKTGTVRIEMFLSFDIGVRHPAGFSFASNFS